MRYPQTLLLSLILILPKFCVAQDETISQIQVAPVKRPLAGGSISGKVLCADTHTPARGARIMVLSASAFGGEEQNGPASGQPQMAITGLDGSFRVASVPPGDYFVLVFAAGYLSPLDGAMVSAKNDLSRRSAIGALLQERAPKASIHGQGAVRVDVELERGAIVTGRVVYSDGSPAAQLPVLLQSPESEKGKGKTDDLADASAMLGAMLLRQNLNTDDQGHFRIAGIPSGRYRLAVTQKFEQSQKPCRGFDIPD